MLQSAVCTQKQMQSEAFRQWAIRLHENPDHLHRKLWEWCFIAQALEERGLLRPGRRGLGFAVGREPLTSLFASFGCHIVATDLDENQAQQAGWVDSLQHATGQNLNERSLCPPDDFRKRVGFRVVDMNDIPADLTGFDFVWSSCSIEHLGSIRAGIRFMLNMTRCLKPGGVAVHTTEFNLSSNWSTVSRGGSVLFRRRDLLRMHRLLTALGHYVEPLNLDTGTEPADVYVDVPPYKHDPHLKLRIGQFTTTSMGMIVTAGACPTRWRQWQSWLRLPLSLPSPRSGCRQLVRLLRGVRLESGT